MNSATETWNSVRDIVPPSTMSDTELAIGLRRCQVNAVTECAARFLIGEGLEQNLSIAVRLLKRSVRLNSPQGKCLLSLMMLEKPLDLGRMPSRRAVGLLREAALDGSEVAQLQFAQLVIQHRGLHDLLSIAVESLQNLASHHSKIAVYELGVLHAEGTGVQRNPREALRYFERAAQMGDADAAFNAGLFHVTGEVGRKAFRAAVRLFQQAAAEDHASACYELGLLCEHKTAARYITVDPQRESMAEEAAGFYRRSAAGGCALGQVNYAVCCINGEGTQSDAAKAASLYALAAIQGNPWDTMGLQCVWWTETVLKPINASRGTGWISLRGGDLPGGSSVTAIEN